MANGIFSYDSGPIRLSFYHRNCRSYHYNQACTFEISNLNHHNCSRQQFIYIVHIFFLLFLRETSLDISCELSARQTIHMKYQDLFSLKITKYFFKMSPATNFADASRVKIPKFRFF